MYILNLMDNTILNVYHLNLITFELNSDDKQLFNKLNKNLTLAFLSRKNGLLEDIYVDYKIQNFSNMGEIIHFRICQDEGSDIK